MQNLINCLHNADCMQFMSELPDKCVDLTLTDIPYDECDKQSNGLREFDKEYANTCNFDIIAFTKELKRVTKGSIYIFCGIEQVSPLFAEIGKDMSARHCIWHKTNPSPANGEHLWLSATENCIYGKFAGATFNEHCHPNVWRCKSGKSKIHKTEKPIELFQQLIKASSNEGDIVFDPCIGSGTTAIAAIHSQRKYIGVEIDPEVFRKCKNKVHKLGRDMFYE